MSEDIFNRINKALESKNKAEWEYLKAIRKAAHEYDEAILEAKRAYTESIKEWEENI